jgi:hypothetical protein
VTSTARIRNCHRSLLEQTDRLIAWAERPDLPPLAAEAVSGWSVGRQLEHLLLSDRMILEGMDGLLAGKLQSAGGGPSLLGRVVLWTGFIPRGRGRAPEGVVPAGMEAEAMAAGFREISDRLEALEPKLGELAASRSTYRHPVLGCFNPYQWLEFVRIHHHHHGKIMGEIAKSAAGPGAEAPPPIP